VYSEHQRAGKPSISVQGVFRHATGDPRMLMRLAAGDQIVFLAISALDTFYWRWCIITEYISTENIFKFYDVLINGCKASNVILG